MQTIMPLPGIWRVPPLEVGHDVGSDVGKSAVAADESFELCPAGLELLALPFFLVLGDLLELLVDGGLQAVGQVELGNPALVVDGNGGAVGHGLLDVVDADVVAENAPGVPIR